MDGERREQRGQCSEYGTGRGGGVSKLEKVMGPGRPAVVSTSMVAWSVRLLLSYH